MGEGDYLQRFKDSPGKEEVSSGGPAATLLCKLQVRQEEPKARLLTTVLRVPTLLREGR